MRQKITGLGGFFFKSKDTSRLMSWYKDKLGVPADDYGWSFSWRDREDPKRVGMTQWGPFKHDTEYFDPSTSSFMLNFRVDDLEAMMAQLAEDGVEQIGDIQDEEYGRFAWVQDCDGNKVELWQPKGEEGQG